MALTKVTGQVIKNTTDVTVGVLTVTNTLAVGGTVSIGGTLTYEDVTNVDAVGLITARNGIVVGSGITLSKDGDGFFTGIVTATTFSGAFSGDGSSLTGVANTNVIFTDKVSLGDNERVSLGIGSDLNIYHDGTDNYVAAANGHLNILGDGSNEIHMKALYNKESLIAVPSGAVTLYHNNSAKLATSASGVTVTGTVAATSYTGDGSALTGIAVGVATTVATGISGITTVLDLSNVDHKITVSGITTVDVRGGTEGDSHSLRIINSGITTVGFSTYFLFPSGASPIIPTADGTLSMISFTVHRQGAVGLATQLFAGASVNFS